MRRLININITLIAAIAKNGIIGNSGGIPWYISEDFIHFKRVTSGPNKVLVMGRKTYDSLPGNKLPGRNKVVLSSNPSLKVDPETVLVTSIEDLILELLFLDGMGIEEVIIIGGREMYSLFLPIATTLVLTELDFKAEGDTYFPEFSKEEFKLVKSAPLTNFETIFINTYKRK